MIYRAPGFLAPPPPLLLSTISKLDRQQTGRLIKRDNLLTEGGGGAKSYEGEKAWSSINHSVLSGLS
jgi:hypothetical protein